MLLFSFYFTKLTSLAVIIFAISLPTVYCNSLQRCRQIWKCKISQKVIWNLLLGIKILQLEKCSKDWEYFTLKVEKNYGKYRECSQTMNDEIFLAVLLGIYFTVLLSLVILPCTVPYRTRTREREPGWIIRFYYNPMIRGIFPARLYLVDSLSWVYDSL
jgi:hypothetical protein